MTPRQRAEFEQLSRLQVERAGQAAAPVRIDARHLGKQDAFCPCCRASSGRFRRETDGGVSLQCGGCGYTGPLTDFVTAEKYQEIVERSRA